LKVRISKRMTLSAYASVRASIASLCALACSGAM
jgi:hypothetical protein